MTLVEVLVSALVALLVCTGTVSAIVGSQRTSDRTLGRNTASNVAEQDQERMRAMAATDLANYTETRSVSALGATYTVQSSTEFVQSPNGDAVSCTSTGAQSRSMRLTTTVIPPPSLKNPTRTVKSIYALPVAQYSPGSGTLVVPVYGADGTGQTGVTITITGPESRSAVTNAAGCAVFQYLETGDYTIRPSASGFVDQNLVSNPSYSATVSSAAVSTAPNIAYDQSGQLSVVADDATDTLTAGITIANDSILVSPKTRTFAGTTAAGLFPFTAPYHAYSGTCAYNDPVYWEPNFYTSRPTVGTATINPGSSVTGIKVHEPTIKAVVKVKTSASSTTVQAGQVVTVKQSDSGCSTASSTTTTATGALTQAFYPYGKYTVCAQYKSGSYYWKTSVANVANTAYNGVAFGTAASPIVIDASSTTGRTTTAPC